MQEYDFWEILNCIFFGNSFVEDELNYLKQYCRKKVKTILYYTPESLVQPTVHLKYCPGTLLNSLIVLGKKERVQGLL